MVAGPVSCVVIICVGVDQDDAFLDLEAGVNPTPHVLFSVNDNLVECLGDSLDAFPVAQPAYISPSRSNRVDLHFRRQRHSGPIGKHQGDFVLSEQIGKLSGQPILVSNLDCEFIVGRQLWQESLQSDNEIIGGPEDTRLKNGSWKTIGPSLSS
jgi:hypothetical protein